MQETLTIEIARPRTVRDLEAVRREAAEKAYREAVFDLIRQGEISSGYGAELLGTNRVDLLEQLRQQGIPPVDYSAEALHKEVQEAMQDFTQHKDRTDADCFEHHTDQ